MTDAGTTQQTGGDKGQQQQQTQGGDAGKSGSMLDVEAIKKAKDGGAGGEQQGATQQTTDADPNKAKDPANTTTEPGKKADRPQFVPEKFWDADKGEAKIEAMSKAFTDMEKAFRAGDHKAPEKADQYKVALDDKQKEVLFGSKDADPHKDPLFNQLTGWGVKNKVSQAAMDEILGLYAEETSKEAGKFQIDVAKERQALGKNADAVIQNQHQFFEQMYKNGEIGEAELNEAKILFETAAGIKLVQAMRARYGEATIPTDTPTEMEGVPSADDLGKMVVDPKYGVDKAFTAKVDGFYTKRYGTAPAMSSVIAK